MQPINDYKIHTTWVDSFQHTCFLTAYSCISKLKTPLFITILTIYLSMYVNIVRKLRKVSLSGPNTYMFAGSSIFCFRQLIVKPIQENPKATYSIRLYDYEGCSNMNASSFITFVTYMLGQNCLCFYKGLYVTFKLAPDL